MVNARVKNAANKEGTAMERERKFRRKYMLEKSAIYYLKIFQNKVNY